MKMKKLIYLLLTFTVLISCNKDDDNNTETITVTLSTAVTGTLNSATIQYNDETGTLKTETLPVGEWNKTFTVSNGYNLFVKAEGTLNGSIQLNTTATGNSISFNEVINKAFNIDTDFEIETSTTL